MEAQFFEQLKAVDDAATAATAADLRATQFHGEHAVALKAHVADDDWLASEFFLGRRFNDGRAGAATE